MCVCVCVCVCVSGHLTADCLALQAAAPLRKRNWSLCALTRGGCGQETPPCSESAETITLPSSVAQYSAIKMRCDSAR